MLRFIIRRLIGAVAVLVVVAFITFAILIMIPQYVLHQNLAYNFTGRRPNPAQLAQINKRYGFNLPWWHQFYLFIKHIFVGQNVSDGVTNLHCSAPCLGYSYKLFTPVTTIIGQDIPVDISLAVGASILWLIVGVTVGSISALKKGSFVDRAGMTMALAAVSFPIFFTGPVLQLVFAYNLKWLPSSGFVGITSNPWQWFEHLIMPWVALAFLFAALYARLTRANMLETMNEDYIRTARAKGLSSRTVAIRHGLRAAITPIVTIFGLDFGQLIGTAVITETIFNMHGIGLQSILAIQQQDFPISMGVTLVAAFAVVAANLIVDIVYAAIDPRVSYS